MARFIPQWKEKVREVRHSAFAKLRSKETDYVPRWHPRPGHRFWKHPMECQRDFGRFPGLNVRNPLIESRNS